MNYLQKNIQWLRCLLMGLSALLVSAACTEYDGPLAGRDAAEVLKDFKFELLHDVTLDVDYGPLSSRALIEVFEENPLADATADDQSPKGQPLYTTFLDEDGSFHGTMNIPTCVEHVYVYSPSWIAPTLKDCMIKDNRVAVSNVPLTWPSTRAQTRGGEGQEYTIRALTKDEITNGSNFYTINGGWNEYGRTNNQNRLLSEGKLSSNVISGIQYKLWNNKTSKVRLFDNHKYRVANVNVKVLETFIDENGDKQDVEDATVWFTMLSEAAWNENAVGYYVYPLGSTPDLKTIKKYIILPNISISGDAPFGVKNSYYIFLASEAPAYTNMRFKLLYQDADGKVSDRFPPNTEIGFFLMSNAFHNGSTVGPKSTIEGVEYDTRAKGALKYADNNFFHSNPGNVNDSRYIALVLPDGSYVYGVEDGGLNYVKNEETGKNDEVLDKDGNHIFGDRSYEDMLFTISANPNKAIKTHDELPEENKVETITDKDTTKDLYTHTYAFEDIWPAGGDYDLNDVVVEHKRSYTYNQFNFVKQVVDVFTIRSIADHTDGFAIQLDPGKHGEMTLPQGAVWEDETNSLILTKKVSNGQVITLTRNLNGINKADIDNEELNPYIINYTLTTDPNARIEVHLPGLAVTSKGLKTEGNSKYYVNETVKFPFAIRIPVGGFKLSPEGVRIDRYYPNYSGWTESSGKSNTDWYTSPNTELDK